MENYRTILLILLLFSCSKKNDSDSIVNDTNKVLPIDYNVNNTLGVLFMESHPAYQEGDSIVVYNEDKSIWYTFSFFSNESVSNEFKPFILDKDYFDIAMKVVEISGDGLYKIVANEQTGSLKFASESDFLKFNTWEEYTMQAGNIEIDQNFIYSDTISFNKIPINGELFKPVSITKNWLEVQSKNSTMLAGWINWRSENGELQYSQLK